jgi:hypothetical protein
MYMYIQYRKHLLSVPTAWSAILFWPMIQIFSKLIFFSSWTAGNQQDAPDAGPCPSITIGIL